MAEREGFEPSIRYKRIHTFQACSLSHSDTSPKPGIKILVLPNRSIGRDYQVLPAPDPSGSPLQARSRSKSLPAILSNPRYAINVYTLSRRAP